MANTVEMLRGLRIGDRAEIGALGYVIRKARNDYVLFAHANTERARWGTAKEIATDIAYLVENGNLPPASGPRW